MGSTSTPVESGLSWWHVPLDRLYKHVTLNDAPQPVDLVFVLAGRMERKRYGLELYGAGVAPRLLLSVGRFEVSKMATLEFKALDELIAQRNRLAPGDRHFFCEINASGIHIERPKLRRWNTYGEILALREFLEPEMPRSPIVVSTDVHLRRAALTVAKVFRGVPITVRYCPVPARLSSLRKDQWWTRLEDRRYVLSETIKLAGYRLILSMSEGMIRRIMRLKDQP